MSLRRRRNGGFFLFTEFLFFRILDELPFIGYKFTTTITKTKEKKKKTAVKIICKFISF